MSRTAVVLVVLTAAGFPLLLWSIGRTVTAMGEGARRWREEGTVLRAYLSHDGALMLADPVLGGNAAQLWFASSQLWFASRR